MGQRGPHTAEVARAERSRRMPFEAQGKPALQEDLGGMGTVFVGMVRGSGSEAEKAFIARRAAERA